MFWLNFDFFSFQCQVRYSGMRGDNLLEHLQPLKLRVDCVNPAGPTGKSTAIWRSVPSQQLLWRWPKTTPPNAFRHPVRKRWRLDLIAVPSRAVERWKKNKKVIFEFKSYYIIFFYSPHSAVKTRTAFYLGEFSLRFFFLINSPCCSYIFISDFFINSFLMDLYI